MNSADFRYTVEITGDPHLSEKGWDVLLDAIDGAARYRLIP